MYTKEENKMDKCPLCGEAIKNILSVKKHLQIIHTQNSLSLESTLKLIEER